MFAPGVVVFEKTQRWEALLKRQFLGQVVQVKPCRLPAEVLAACQAMPGSVAVIDLRSNPILNLKLISQLVSQAPQSPIVVLSPLDLAELEWPAREFGASHFLLEPILPDELGRLCQRHLQRVYPDPFREQPA